MHGKFITVEGIDGAGKSTHLDWLVAALRERGKPVVQTREPGGTALGESLRSMLLSQPMHRETEALLMFAARREHIAQVIEPALSRGDWVVCDRFTDASFAYQGGGRGLGIEKLAQLEAWVQGSLQPDLTLLFDLSPEVARQRVVGMNRDLDRFEQERQDFFDRVRGAYLDRAKADSRRIRLIDAGRNRDEIKETLEQILITFCE